MQKEMAIHFNILAWRIPWAEKPGKLQSTGLQESDRTQGLNNNKGYKRFLGDSVVKTPPANAGDAGHSGLILGSGRSPGGGHGNPLQFSCLENPMDRAVWLAIQSMGLQRVKCE